MMGSLMAELRDKDSKKPQPEQKKPQEKSK